MSKVSLLKKAIWNTTDIMEYFDVKKSKALDIKHQALVNGGAVQFNSRMVKVDKVLELVGTSREAEIKIWKSL